MLHAALASNEAREGFGRVLRVRHAALGASDAPDGYLLGEEQPATRVKEEPEPDGAADEPSAGTKRSLDDTGSSAPDDADTRANSSGL